MRGLIPILLALLCVAPIRGEETVEGAAERLGVSLSPTAPTAIRADELTASTDPRGGERVVFEGNVEVEQGAVRISCDRLEASYAADGEGAPRRYVARGNVRIRQEGDEARCGEAIFDGPQNRITCRGVGGPAVLRRRTDSVEGSEIVFDLASSRVRVSGGAVVRVEPRAGEKP